MNLENIADLADVVDGLESIVLRRRDSTATFDVPAACRLRVVCSEAEPSEGIAVEANAVWYLQPGGAVVPQVGDRIVDAEGGQWTVLGTEKSKLLNRWKCTTRELRIAYGCGERVDIERAIWQDSGSGPVIVGWYHLATALPARIQPWELTRDSETGETHARFRILLGESFPLEPDDRFVASDGTIYRLESYQQADRIDRLPVAEVVRESA